MYIAYLADSTSEPESVLHLLSPQAKRLWEDMLKDEMILGEEGVKHYRSMERGFGEDTERLLR
jgi:hypothetical protein